MSEEQENQYLGLMLTATCKNDTGRLHAIIKRLQELEERIAP